MYYTHFLSTANLFDLRWGRKLKGPFSWCSRKAFRCPDCLFEDRKGKTSLFNSTFPLLFIFNIVTIVPVHLLHVQVKWTVSVRSSPPANAPPCLCWTLVFPPIVSYLCCTWEHHRYSKEWQQMNLPHVARHWQSLRPHCVFSGSLSPACLARPQQIHLLLHDSTLSLIPWLLEVVSQTKNRSRIRPNRCLWNGLRLTPLQLVSRL